MSSPVPPTSLGGGTIWYRSLYWRIAVGLVLFLSLMLVAQGALFIYTSDRIAGSMPATSPRRLAVLVASDLTAALDSDPTIDITDYVRDQYSQVFQPFIVLMRDGREVSNHPTFIPDVVRNALRREVARGELPARGRVFVPRRTDDDRFRGGPPPFQLGEFAAVFMDGEPVGTVAVLLGRPPMGMVVRELAPTMALVGGSVLIVGSALIAVFVFGPARRRMKQLQEATVRFGAGDLTARAPERGGDEVAALARSFNEMGDELASRARALEASDTARRQLLADVSHELMTPLTAMRGYIETLTMRELNLDGSTRDRYLHIIDDETHRLERIIGDLLDLARLEGGGGTLRREEVPVQALFERVHARHERELTERHITLAANIAKGAEVVQGDPDRLEQALQNLAANALRHTPDGGEIVMSADVVGDNLRLRVRDSGAGIPPEHLPLIFDRFYKVDASRKAAGGSGLGLSIVRAIVERHGGSISAHNEGGAVFDVLLPLSPATDSSPSTI
ncbi:MAG TPA: HAMP domain-containing sensor histidine kinase [Vicinamibacterales bacterium]|jgi:two-component system sensor histidine kinase BaeS|nr:HAMP domain-containing sensor histidine kinase [Vicinamibacterales bacterium]